MKYTRLCLLNYNLVKDLPRLQSKKRKLQTLFHRLQSKRKDKELFKNHNLDLGARLQNGKVLGTHSAQTKSGLLDSKLPFIYPFK